jgi:predicted glycogen debranching enzyme
VASLGRNILGNISEASQLEWLVTNGIGGYASSTVTGMNTRRYHGVLVAARRPPTERIVLVNRLEETLFIDGEEVALSTNRYKNTLSPCGYFFQESFHNDPIPTWVFQYQDTLLIKSLFMVYGTNTTVVTYKAITNGRSMRLEVRPHFLFRDFHGNMFENAGFDDNTQIQDRGFRLQPFFNAPALFCAWDRGSFVREGYWYRENFLQAESDRGLNALEDDYSNGFIDFEEISGTVALMFSDQPTQPFHALELRRKEKNRLEAIASSMNSDDDFLRHLLLAADQFIVERQSTRGKTILAGYPWFADWGRDSLISLPGLTLVPRRFEAARSILLTFAATIKNGLVPNCFADKGNEALYNSVDASLWFFFAVYKFVEYTDDYDFVQEKLFPALTQIIESYQGGTMHNIRMDPEDGLISAGDAGVQLTWMDAKVGEQVITPRHGKAVEINALWYNSLKIYKLLLDRMTRDSNQINSLCRKVKASFRRKFWNAEQEYLYDVIPPEGAPDDTFRPNQIFAVYLPFPLLEPPEEKVIVDQIFQELYTSFGLRSLSPHDPQYRPTYQGDRLSRDMSYHQGTVWAYLIGPFITSYLKVYNYSMEAQLRASHMIEPLKISLESDGCLGSIAEIFEGAPPHQARGCFAQAWSVAELLRVYVEDIKGQKPLMMV